LSCSGTQVMSNKLLITLVKQEGGSAREWSKLTAN
jgi:hypothetical protein